MELKKLGRLILLGLLLATSACGGGTSGTGDYSGHQARVQGTLVLNSGDIAPGYVVTVEETGASAVTDENGDFAIDTVLNSPNASLLVQGDSFSASTELTDIPAGAQVIDVVLQVSTSNDTVAVISVQVFDNTSAPAVKAPDGSREGNNDSNDSPRADSEFRGNVRFEDNSPGKGVKLSISGTDASDTADRSGNFSIKTKPVGGKVKLKVSYKGDSTSITLSGIPKRAVIVQLKLRVQRARSSADGIGTDSVFDAQLLDIKTKDAN